jgi:hypothetical protein
MVTAQNVIVAIVAQNSTTNTKHRRRYTSDTSFRVATTARGVSRYTSDTSSSLLSTEGKNSNLIFHHLNELKTSVASVALRY